MGWICCSGGMLTLLIVLLVHSILEVVHVFDAHDLHVP